ncbi:MAG: hypothetical protein WCJ07_09200 [Verrucomicrobiota bacterium]
MNTKTLIFQKVILMTGLALLCACRSATPSSSAVQPGMNIPPPSVSLVGDDIPPEASPAIRAHLTKLREMRNLGQINDSDYQSRKAALLNR